MRRKNITGEMMMDYITGALLILMKNKAYDRISIGEITEKAGVNRSTYYRHFETKESVIRYYYDKIMQEYMNEVHRRSVIDDESYLHIMFSTFFEHKEDLLLIHQAGLSVFLLDVLLKWFHFDEIENLASAEQQFKSSYHIGGIYSNMLLWFSHGMRESPKEMTSIAMSYRPERSMTLLNVGANPG